jgi:hypothetical protein
MLVASPKRQRKGTNLPEAQKLYCISSALSCDINMPYFESPVGEQTQISVKVIPDVFDNAELDGFIDGELIKNGVSLYIYAELGRKIQYQPPRSMPKTKYKKFINCPAVCFAKTPQERDDGIFMNEAELPNKEITRVDVVIYC